MINRMNEIYTKNSYYHVFKKKMIFISIRYYVTLQMNLLDLDENLGIVSGRLSFSSHNILPHHQLIC